MPDNLEVEPASLHRVGRALNQGAADGREEFGKRHAQLTAVAAGLFDRSRSALGGPARLAGVSVNGDLAFTPTAQGARIDGSRTDFPWFEAYQSFPDGRQAVLSQDAPEGIGRGSSLGPTLNLLGHHDLGDGADSLKGGKWANPDPIVPQPIDMFPSPGHGPQ
ncbi:hypothetical protein [Williamsia herbipolensis]|uniref:hypothetical protein n=1 Tax=Williamsia herbipolensis TaxID=1603258 RepID=UPI000B06A8B1|nr:hypothetical protein [Williamsia herbipolensis]